MTPKTKQNTFPPAPNSLAHLTLLPGLSLSNASRRVQTPTPTQKVWWPCPLSSFIPYSFFLLVSICSYSVLLRHTEFPAPSDLHTFLSFRSYIPFVYLNPTRHFCVLGINSGPHAVGCLPQPPMLG